MEMLRFQSETIEDDIRALILHGISMKASDIHFNPRSDGVALLFRVNGDLVEYMVLPAETYQVLEYSLKRLAGTNPVSPVPQDGRIEISYDGKSTALRFASIHCEVHGCSKITMRITDKDPNLLKLEALGLEPSVLDDLKSALLRNFGLFLTTGPTGSGKTTTLYGALNFIKATAALNILTVEDPVEFPIDGVVQINARPEVPFDDVLVSFMRQDPDVIMVGEIRNRESADTAIRAAMTGHLVISTLHANTALISVTRMMNLGVDPFDLAFTLTGLLGQRLTKKLCSCREKYPITADEKLIFSSRKKAPPEVLYRENLKGCEKCREKSPGVASRMGIYEMVVFDSTRQNFLYNLIQSGKAIEQNFQEAYRLEKPSYRPLLERALIYLYNGIITTDEFIRLQ